MLLCFAFQSLCHFETSPFICNCGSYLTVRPDKSYGQRDMLTEKETGKYVNLNRIPILL